MSIDFYSYIYSDVAIVMNGCSVGALLSERRWLF